MIHYYVSYLADNYNEIDETILDYYGAENSIRSLAEDIKNTFSSTENTIHMSLKEAELDLLAHIMRYANYQLPFIMKKEKGDEKAFSALEKIHETLWGKLYTSRVKGAM